METAAEDTGLYYLYGVARWDEAAKGLSAPRLDEVRHGGLVALVERVDPARFAPATLEKTMGSIDWVAGVARRHHEVLSLAMEHGPVVPARICTLFGSEEAIAASLSRDQERLLAALGRVEGCEEWGVKVLCDEARFRERVAAEGEPEEAPGAETAGVAYLRAKRRDARVRERFDRRLADVVAEVDSMVRPLAMDARGVGGYQAPQEQGPEVVQNLAVLVRAEEREAFLAVTEVLNRRHGGEGIQVSVTGPWPPYSFCEGGGDARDPAEAS